MLISQDVAQSGTVPEHDREPVACLVTMTQEKKLAKEGI